MRIVTNKEISSFKVLPFELYTDNRVKILDAGEVLTPGKLIMLKNHAKLYTEDYSAENDSEDQSSSDKTLAQLLNYTYEGIDTTDFDTIINKDAYIKTDAQVKIKYYYKRTLDLLIQGYYQEGLCKLNSLVGILKSEVLKKINKSSKGSRIRFFGEYELCHSLNVAIVSGLIAKKLDYSSMSVDQVLLASLLHDIGKLKINALDVNAMITTNEEVVRDHPILGYRLLRDELELPDEIAKVALEHHENNDGSGYPQGLSSDYISEYSQIINVANYYDNLAFNRTHNIVMSNKEALRTMLEVGTKKFSAKMLYSFIHMFNYDDSKNFNDMMI